MTIDVVLDAILKRERAITLAGLAGLVGLAWIYLLRLDREMTSMAEMGMARMAPWTATDAALTAAMWAVMMVAMMLPAAAPMLLIFTHVNRKRLAAGATPYVDVGVFTLGYLVVWGALSVVAALAQWALHTAALLSDEALRVTPLIGGVLLLAAGIYQLTPFKYACLARCQSPIGFVLSEWREGTGGVLVMGIRHGLFCLGCCWALMALLFVGGIMNLVWVAAITAFVLAEKVLPTGRLVSYASGTGLIGWAAWSLRQAL